MNTIVWCVMHTAEVAGSRGVAFCKPKDNAPEVLIQTAMPKSPPGVCMYDRANEWVGFEIDSGKALPPPAPPTCETCQRPL